jgi:hypothetical protein
MPRMTGTTPRSRSTLKGSETIAGQNPNGSPNAGKSFNFTASSLAPVDHDMLTVFAHLHSDLFLI